MPLQFSTSDEYRPHPQAGHSCCMTIERHGVLENQTCLRGALLSRVSLTLSKFSEVAARVVSKKVSGIRISRTLPEMPSSDWKVHIGPRETKDHYHPSRTTLVRSRDHQLAGFCLLLISLMIQSSIWIHMLSYTLHVFLLAHEGPTDRVLWQYAIDESLLLITGDHCRCGTASLATHVDLTTTPRSSRGTGQGCQPHSGDIKLSATTGS